MKKNTLPFLLIIISLFVAIASVASSEEKKKEVKEQFVTLDFVDIDLPVLVKFISDLTGKNFIFDESLKGKVTIISPTRIKKEEVYAVFLTILQSKGFTTVQSGNFVRIIPSREAKQSPVETIIPEEEKNPEEKFITRLIPLQYTRAQDLITAITPLVSRDGLAVAYPPSNAIIITDSATNIERILKIIKELDVETVEYKIEVIHLKHANAEVMAKELQALIEARPSPAQQPTAPKLRGPARAATDVVLIKIIPDARTNSLIVLAGKDEIEEIKRLVSLIDYEVPKTQGKIHVYYLENADAEELAKVLSSLTSGIAKPPTPRTGQPPTAAPEISIELMGEVKITADKATNSLVIIASPQDFETLKEVIKKLDIRRRQVYVEALIMEVSLDKSRQVGVEFQAFGGKDDKYLIGGGTNLVPPPGNLASFLASITAGTLPTLTGSGLTTVGIFDPIKITLPDGTVIQTSALNVILRAVQADSRVNILSNPHILTSDNKEAEIVVGQNVPFIVSQQRDTTGLALIATVDRRDVGITLRITPQISESEFIKLNIYQEISALAQVAGLDPNLVGPTISKRSAKSSIVAKNGQTVVIGGLIKDDRIINETKVPILGDIPIIKWLFSYQSQTTSKTNLLIFLTPHIIKEQKDIEEISKGKEKAMEEFLKKEGIPKRKVIIIPEETRSGEEPGKK